MTSVSRINCDTFRVDDMLDSYREVSKEVNSLAEETNPDLFRKKVIPFLSNHALTITDSLRFGDPHKIHKIITKIHLYSKTEEYVVRKFKTSDFGRKIPVLEIANITEEKFILDETPKPPHAVESEEEAHSFVQTFAKMPIPWNCSDGCETRAEMGCRLLKSMNLPDGDIKKIWIRGSLRTENSSRKTRNWTWHIAPLIITRSGKKLVIDPSIHQEKALSPSEWILSMTKDIKEVTHGEIAGNYTVISDARQVLVTDTIFENYKKTIYVNIFSSVVEESPFLENMLLCVLPPRLNLEDTAESIPLTPNADSHCCVIS